jgi:hypothetical protein
MRMIGPASLRPSPPGEGPGEGGRADRVSETEAAFSYA